MIRCVAIDDEPIALTIIAEYCRRYGGIELHTFTSPVAGMEYVLATHPDIVFLDIEMQSHNGLQLARQLPEHIVRIFTTAYSDYALEGFNADAVDFLQKPIFYPRFERAMEKATKLLSVTSEAEGSTITVKVEHKTVMIKASDITHIEAMDNYVKIFRRNQPMVLPQITMKEMEGKLPEGKFLRVHRSYIVAVSEIEKYSNKEIVLRGSGRIIPVGRKYSEDFRDLQRRLSAPEA